MCHIAHSVDIIWCVFAIYCAVTPDALRLCASFGRRGKSRPFASSQADQSHDLQCKQLRFCLSVYPVLVAARQVLLANKLATLPFITFICNWPRALEMHAGHGTAHPLQTCTNSEKKKATTGEGASDLFEVLFFFLSSYYTQQVIIVCFNIVTFLFLFCF